MIPVYLCCLLIPTASPHESFMHGKKETCTTKNIISIGLPMCLIAQAVCVFIDSPLISPPSVP